MNKYPKWATAAVQAAQRDDAARFKQAVDDTTLALRVIGIEAIVTTDAPIILDDFVFTATRVGGDVELYVLDRITDSYWEVDIDRLNNIDYEDHRISFGKWILDIMEERATKETPDE